MWSHTNIHTEYYTISSSVWINRIRLPILLMVSSKGKVNNSLSPFAPENLVSRNGFGSVVPSRVSLLVSILGLNLVLTYYGDSSRVPRRRLYIYFYNHTPSYQTRVYRVKQLRTDDVTTTESPPAQGAALAGHHKPINMRVSFHPLPV